MLICLSHRLLTLGFVVLTVFIVSAHLTSAIAQNTDAEALRHFQAAQKAQEGGFFDLAAQEYLKVIQLLPEAAEAYASLGLAYNAEGKFAESAQALRKAERLKPGLPGVSLYLGIDYVKLRQPASAIPHLREAARLEPANKQAQTWLGTALWNNGQILAALEQLRRTCLLFPSDPVPLLDLGEAYRKAADQEIDHILAAAGDKPLLHQVYGDIYRDEHAWQRATRHYYHAIAQDPHWFGAYFGLGEVALDREKLDEAEQAYRHELQVNPSSAAALARLAEIAMLNGKADDALALLSSAVHIAPEQASNAVGLPRFYPAAAEEFSEQTNEQLRKCLPVLEVAPASPSRSLAIALANTQLGNLDASVAAWKDFLGTTSHATPTNPYESGVANFNRHDFLAAETDLRAWLKLQPNDLQAQYLLARTYRNLSLSTLAQLLAEAPDSYPAHQLLAEAYEDTDEDDKALAEYKIVEKIAPNLPNLHFSIGNLLLRMNQQDQALKEFEVALRLNPDHAETNAEMGALLLAQLEQAKAIPYLEKAIRLNPELWVTQRQLGTAYYMQKDYTKAEAALQQAARHDADGSAHYQLGLVYHILGREEQANAQFQISRKIKLARLSDVEAQFAIWKPSSQQ